MLAQIENGFFRKTNIAKASRLAGDERSTSHGDCPLSPRTFTHKDSRFLTFLNDSLIDCTDKMGHVYEKIKVRVGNQYIEY